MSLAQLSKSHPVKEGEIYFTSTFFGTMKEIKHELSWLQTYVNYYSGSEFDGGPYAYFNRHDLLFKNMGLLLSRAHLTPSEGNWLNPVGANPHFILGHRGYDFCVHDRHPLLKALR